MAGARLLHARAKSSRGCQDHRGKTQRPFPNVDCTDARATRSRTIHSERRRDLCFDQAVPIVEANTARVLSRLFNLQTPIDEVRGREFLWDRAAQLVPKRNAARFNSALLDLGALVCIQRAPRCGICPVKMFCRASNPETLPRKKPRLRNEKPRGDSRLHHRAWQHFASTRSARWRGMWILPPLKLDGLKPSSLEARAVYTAVFPFTHHRVMLRVFRAKAPGKR